MKNEICHKSNTDVYLVNPPIGIPNVPSLALGILKPAAIQAGLTTKVLYANLLFAKHVGIDIYETLNIWANSATQLIEILFQPYAGYEDYASIDEIEQFFLHSYNDYRDGFERFKEAVLQAWSGMDEYLDMVCERILADNPRAVGCSYGLQQANSSLAILKRIRERCPDIVTFIGGSSCSEYAGQALVDHMPQLDYVFCGESDDIFGPALMYMLARNNDMLREKYPSVLMKGGRADTHVMRVMDDIPYPDYDDYFEQLEEFGIDRVLSVVLPFETSRGCWWGCKKKCNFCGLHNSRDSIAYRKKNIHRSADELDYLSNRYNVKEFIFTDCILDQNDITQFPDLIGERGYNSYAEVKTNISLRELESLKAAGFIWLQPGLESIHDEILLHINKGNRGIKHIEFLKWATTIGLTCFWNMMTGFPGEKISWYEETIAMIPLLHHLNPPRLNTFIYQRNSYFTMHHEEYGSDIHKAEFYKYYFGKDDNFHEEFAEFYEDPDRKMAYHSELEETIDNWRHSWEAGAIMTYFTDGVYMGIYDSRPCASNKRTVLTGLKKRICELSESALKIQRLYELIPDHDKGETDKAIEELKTSGILIQIKDEVLFLAMPKELLDNSKKKFYHVGLMIRKEDEAVNLV